MALNSRLKIKTSRLNHEILTFMEISLEVICGCALKVRITAKKGLKNVSNYSGKNILVELGYERAKFLQNVAGTGKAA